MGKDDIKKLQLELTTSRDIVKSLEETSKSLFQQNGEEQSKLLESVTNLRDEVKQLEQQLAESHNQVESLEKIKNGLMQKSDGEKADSGRMMKSFNSEFTNST